MTIVLTGDVHHMSLRTRDQRHLTRTEPEAAYEYAGIARERGVKVTLFVTGRAAVEEPDVIRALAAMANVELGGHDYYAAQPRWLYNGIFRRVVRLDKGPRWYQAWEVARTARVIRERTGVAIRSWRGHAYRQDRNTRGILARQGLRVVSNHVTPNALHPFAVGPDLVELPLNVIPDHEYMIHGDFGRENNRTTTRSGFSDTLLTPHEWLEAVHSDVQRVTSGGGVATILAHPGCMEIADGHQTFTALCDWLADRDTRFATEAAGRRGGS